MIISTTPSLEGKHITNYYGVVTGETIIGANLFRDLFAGIRDIVGGRASSYEKVLRELKTLKEEFNFYDEEGELVMMFPDRHDDDFDEDRMSASSFFGDD